MFRSGRLTTSLPALFFFCLISILQSSLPAQAPLESPFPQPAPVETDAPAEADEQPEKISPETVLKITTSIEGLGSKEFAVRERAATQLMEIGAPTLPELRRIAKESADPEVRLRADQIIKQLTQGDMQAKIKDFLAGEEVDFDGWRVAQAILGDSDGVRELFVELMTAYPEVTSSLEGTPRDRAMAMDAVVTRVQNAMFVERRFPTRDDAFALLLPAVDPNVPLNAAFENVLLSVLQKDAASRLRRDSQLSGPFIALLSRWITRSTLASRDDVLLFGMSWDVPATLLLARQTLVEANQTETLAFALQAIARFGTARRRRAGADFVG